MPASSCKLRTLHHLPCSGGTLISKCLAVMPDVVLISEVNPLAPPRLTFNPTDPLAQFVAQYDLLDEVEKQAAFLDRLRPIVQKCLDLNRILILRDHLQSDLMHQQPRPIRALLDTLIREYEVMPIVTLRNPIDSFLAARQHNWIRQLDHQFEIYCQRVLLFLERYADFRLFHYEAFVVDPDRILRQMCDVYGLTFDPGYRDRFYTMQLTGDSGRKSPEIGPRDRRPMDAETVTAIRNSASFHRLMQRFGYDLPAYPRN